jgi:hypothetical protein
MKWQKHGLVFSAPQAMQWANSHTQKPVVDVSNNDYWDIYFSSRDGNGYSLLGRVRVEPRNPKNILDIYYTPLLKCGPPGSFDDCGVMPSCIVNTDQQKRLYYIGWSRKLNVPYQNSIGIADIQSDGKPRKLFDGPILGQSINEPFFTATPFVAVESKKWNIWYLSCKEWIQGPKKLEPIYNIKHRVSKDGIDWSAPPTVAIELRADEGGIASPSVLKIKQNYYMWYCYRARIDYRDSIENTYRIGFAISKDGLKWQRRDHETGIELSSNGWDSQMQAYPNVVAKDHLLYMFYNGNGFGESGIGYATMAVTDLLEEFE